MDPITAIFNFLSTPGGQVIVIGIEKEIQALIQLFHRSHPTPTVLADSPAAPAPIPAKVV